MSLFDPGPRARWGGSRSLVPVDPAACPSCAGLVVVVTVAEVPLFRHGGYGAVRRTTSRVCAAALRRRCGWGVTSEITEVNPRRYGVGAA